MTSRLISSLEQSPDVLSWVDFLIYRAQNQPEQIAYTFLGNGNQETARLTYQELDTKARAIAAYLQSQGATDERVLLVYSPSL